MGVSGELTGGDGFISDSEQLATYQFQVPPDESALAVDLHSSTGDFVLGALIDPAGIQTVASANADPNDFNSATADMQSVVPDPAPGLWTYVITDQFQGGLETPFTGTVSFAVPDAITQSGVPNSTGTLIAPGSSTTASVTIKNSGPVPLAMSVDPRLNSIGPLTPTLTYQGSRE